MLFNVVKINHPENLRKILKVEISLSVLKLMYLSEHITYLSTLVSESKAPSTRIRFQRSKRLKTIKTSKNLLFACQDIYIYIYRFQIFPLWRPFSKVIVFSENYHRFCSSSCRCKVKTQRKVCGFDENNMKTYSCRRGLSRSISYWNLIIEQRPFVLWLIKRFYFSGTLGTIP